MQNCSCLDRGPAEYDTTWVGTDKTGGRFADVEVRACRACGRLWLRYQYEIEAFSRSGRWYTGVLTPEQASGLTPESAPAVLEALPWYVYGGSYFGHGGQRGSGPIS